MIVVSLIRIALGALWANRLRSGLTLLGVIIGVTSVMTIISALEGIMGAIEEDLAVLGPTTFIVQRFGMTTSEAEFHEMMKRKPLSHNALDLREEVLLKSFFTALSAPIQRLNRIKSARDPSLVSNTKEWLNR